MNRAAWARRATFIFGVAAVTGGACGCASARPRPSQAQQQAAPAAAGSASAPAGEAAKAGPPGAAAPTIALAGAEQGPTQDPAVPWVVRVQLFADGELLLDGQSVGSGEAGDETLLARARLIHSRNSGARAVIMADARARHGDVMHVLDLLKRAGLTRVSFAASPAGPGATPPNNAQAESVAAPAASESAVEPVPRARPISQFDCGFPPKLETSDPVSVSLVVAVDERGKARWVRVLEDPGFGYGQVATTCALRAKYEPGRDAAGKPVPAQTPTITIRFQR